MTALLRLSLLGAFHDSWKATPAEAHLSVGAAGFGAWLAHVDFGAAIAVVAYAAMIIGGVAIALWKQLKVAQVEIRDAERQAEDRRAARQLAQSAK